MQSLDSILIVYLYGSWEWFDEALVIFKVKNSEQSTILSLFGKVWTKDHTKERQTLTIEINLLSKMSLQVLNRGINIKDWVAMVPS